MLINKKNLLVSLMVILTLFFIINGLILAQTPPNLQNPPDLREQIETNMSQAGTNAGYNVESVGTAETTAVSYQIGLIINILLGFLGVIFLILIIYSGFQWMTAGGNEETITKAKKRLTNAAIGLVIILTAYVISWFILTSLWYDVLFSNP